MQHNDLLQPLRESRARITTARRALAGYDTYAKRTGTSSREDGLIEENGRRYLTMRHLLGLPDPDGKAWCERMLRYHLGTAYLLEAAQHPDFNVQDVPDELRGMITHPIYDRPATDRELVAIIITHTE